MQNKTNRKTSKKKNEKKYDTRLLLANYSIVVVISQSKIREKWRYDVYQPTLLYILRTHNKKIT